MEQSERCPLLPLRRVAGYGLLLNGVWEFGQCLFLFDMWRWTFWRTTVWMWAAILDDVLIVLGVALLAGRLAGKKRLLPPDRRGAAALILVGFIAAVLLEWAARVMGLWAYGPLMPTLTIFGHEVGLSPIVQGTFLPAASVWLATKRPRQQRKSE